MAARTVFDQAGELIFVDHSAVDGERNPALKALGAMTPDHMARLIVQYAAFSRAIVGILSSARESLGSWAEVAQELDRNIAEELGSGVAEDAHFTVFSKGLAGELGISVDPGDGSAGTRTFLNTIESLVRNPAPAIAAGAVYTIEATAICELKVVESILESISRQTRECGLRDDGLLHRFLESHISGFEPRHEQGLHLAIEPHLGTADRQALFLSGCRGVMEAMDSWWAGITATA